MGERDAKFRHFSWRKPPSIRSVASRLGGLLLRIAQRYPAITRLDLQIDTFRSGQLGAIIQRIELDGMQRAWHSDELFEFRAEFVDELASIACARITRPERYFLIAATGDEVLDWRQMVAHYPGARHTIIEGSDHGLSDFAQHVEAVIDFCRS